MGVVVVVVMDGLTWGKWMGGKSVKREWWKGGGGD